VLSGNFGAFLPSMSFGVKGAILAVANVAAGASVSMVEAVRVGRWREAGEIHLRLLPVARAVTTQYGVPGLKAALDRLGYYGGPPREPLLPLTDGARDEVARILREAALLT
jgi:4-hydroxy-2-oxoglutarate aldolase